MESPSTATGNRTWFVVFIVLLVVVTTYFLDNPSGAPTAATENKGQPIAEAGVHPALLPGVGPIQGEAVEINGFLIKPIGVDLAWETPAFKVRDEWKSNRDFGELGDIIGDTFETGMGLTDDELRKYKEDENKDALIAIYFEIRLREGERAKIPENIPISLVDDQGAESFVPKGKATLSTKTVSPGEIRIDRVVLRAYSDAKAFTLKLGDKEYHFDAPPLPPKKTSPGLAAPGK